MVTLRSGSVYIPPPTPSDEEINSTESDSPQLSPLPSPPPPMPHSPSQSPQALPVFFDNVPRGVRRGRRQAVAPQIQQQDPLQEEFEEDAAGTDNLLRANAYFQNTERKKGDYVEHTNQDLQERGDEEEGEGDAGGVGNLLRADVDSQRIERKRGECVGHSNQDLQERGDEEKDEGGAGGGISANWKKVKIREWEKTNEEGLGEREVERAAGDESNKDLGKELEEREIEIVAGWGTEKEKELGERLDKDSPESHCSASDVRRLYTKVLKYDDFGPSLHIGEGLVNIEGTVFGLLQNQMAILEPPFTRKVNVRLLSGSVWEADVTINMIGGIIAGSTGFNLSQTWPAIIGELSLGIGDAIRIEKSVGRSDLILKKWED